MFGLVDIGENIRVWAFKVKIVIEKSIGQRKIIFEHYYLLVDHFKRVLEVEKKVSLII